MCEHWNLICHQWWCPSNRVVLIKVINRQWSGSVMHFVLDKLQGSINQPTDQWDYRLRISLSCFYKDYKNVRNKKYNIFLSYYDLFWRKRIVEYKDPMPYIKIIMYISYNREYCRWYAEWLIVSSYSGYIYAKFSSDLNAIDNHATFILL